MIIQSETIAVCDRCGGTQAADTNKPHLAVVKVLEKGWGLLRGHRAAESGNPSDRQALLCPACFFIIYEQVCRFQKEE